MIVHRNNIHPCSFKDDRKHLCGRPAYRLSMHDTVKKYDKLGMPESYDRETKWKCDAGHRTVTRSVMKAEELVRKPEPSIDRSKKRFHRKGFHGHVSAKSVFKPLYSPLLTNHTRHVARQEHRQRLHTKMAEAK